MVDNVSVICVAMQTERWYHYVGNTMLCKTTSYRYQLEAFIDKIKGRNPKVWISPEDSINQMKAVEMVYNKVEQSCFRTSCFDTSFE